MPKLPRVIKTLLNKVKRRPRPPRPGNTVGGR